MNDTERKQVRDAFLAFLADSEIDNDGDSERGNIWVCNAEHGLQIEALAHALGFQSMEEAMYEAELWDVPDKEE